MKVTRGNSFGQPVLVAVCQFNLARDILNQTGHGYPDETPLDAAEESDKQRSKQGSLLRYRRDQNDTK